MATRLSEDEKATLITLVRGGADLGSAARHIGWDPGVFVVWLDKRPQKALRSQLKRAAAQIDLQDIAKLANEESWQAARARLDMRQVADRELHLHRLRALTTD